MKTSKKFAEKSLKTWKITQKKGRRGFVKMKSEKGFIEIILFGKKDTLMRTEREFFEEKKTFFLCEREKNGAKGNRQIK